MRPLTAAITAALILLTAAPASAEAVNQPPVAVDDFMTYRNIGGIDYIVPALANDSDPDGDPLVYTAVTPATKGNAYLKDGKLFYKPYFGNEGTDSFTYTVSDGQGNTATGTVTATLWVDPAQPLDPAITSSAPGSVTLTWSAAARAAEYRIRRNGVVVDSTSGLSWSDTGLSDTASYEYRIVPVNGGGYEGWWATPLYRRQQMPTPTAVAVDITDDPTTLSVTWDDGGMLGPWRVYRDGAQVASTMVPRFGDTGLVTGREYAYQVQLVGSTPPGSLDVPSLLSAPATATPVELSSIGRYFWDAGWSTGGLGPITVAERAVPDGRQQDHTRGLILQQDGEEPFSVRGVFATAYTAVSGAIGH
nr:Ig-like domain-containing protein [Actinomycetota bacterium]